MRCEFLLLNCMSGAPLIASLCVNVGSAYFAKHMGACLGAKNPHGDLKCSFRLLWLKLISLVQILWACKLHLYYPHKILAQSKNYCVP